MGFCLRYIYGYASELGTSHLKTGHPCQDGSIVFHSVETKLTIALAFDGAGSAASSHIGVQIAKSSAANLFMSNQIGKLDSSTFKTYCAEIIESIRSSIEDEALASGTSIRDFATTLLGAVISDDFFVMIQIGDGGIVFDAGDGFELFEPPQKGEYANTTRFITDIDSASNASIKFVNKKPRRLAMFTDGIEHLAIDFKEMKPFSPMFAMLFDAIESVTFADEGSISEAISQFLTSERVEARTDDDKTLILLSSRES